MLGGVRSQKEREKERSQERHQKESFNLKMGRRGRDRSPSRPHKASSADYHRVPHNNFANDRSRKRSTNMPRRGSRTMTIPIELPKNGGRRPNQKGGPGRSPRPPSGPKPRRRSPNKTPRPKKTPEDEAKDLESYKVISKIVRAILARLLFVIHSVVTTWQTVKVYDQQLFWSFSFISMAILIEGVIVIFSRAGNERKWFCWSLFLYIAATVPPIWMLELHLSKQRYQAWTSNSTNNNTYTGSQIQHNVYVGNEIWVQLLEQFLLVILIVGRWLLPKGEITREQLSQILLAYLAIASDIVELFDVFKERAIAFHAGLRYFLLGAWTLSLLQFPFVITTSRARKMRIALTTTTSEEDMKRVQNRVSMRENGIIGTFDGILHDLDIWAIILANGLQDIPFLIMRLTLMFGYDVFTYTMIFFTCKNFLILALQGYRMGILINDRYIRPTPEQDVKKLTKHYREMLSHCRSALHKLKESDPEAFAELVPPKPKRKSHPYPRESDADVYDSESRSRRVSKSQSKGTNESLDRMMTTDDANTSTMESRRTSKTKEFAVSPRRKQRASEPKLRTESAMKDKREISSPAISRTPSPTQDKTMITSTESAQSKARTRKGSKDYLDTFDDTITEIKTSTDSATKKPKK